MTKESEFRDIQVKLAIKELGRCNFIQIMEYCIMNFSKFAWSYDNIRNSITRLYKKNKINIEYEIIKYDYNLKNTTFIQTRRMKFISLAEEVKNGKQSN